MTAMTLTAGGFMGETFTFDPKKARPQRLRETLRLIAHRVDDCLARYGRFMGRRTHRALFVTLTYAANTKGDPGDVSHVLKCVREWLRRQGLEMCPYLWVAELQKRGALHYHLMLWLPRHLHLPRLDRRGWWHHGMTKVEAARNPVGYMVKYASKFKDDIARFRKGTRLYGYGGLMADVRRFVREARWPRWARKARTVQLDAAWVCKLDAEIDAQEREDAALLHEWWPDDYPEPEPPDPDDEQAELDAHQQECEEQERWAELVQRGRSEFARCVGGFVDRVTGEFFETPYLISFDHGVLTLRRKDAVTDEVGPVS